jgi:hypothetical protein
VIVTTNHLLSSVFLPEDDRRFDVIETATFEEMQLTDGPTRAAYFSKLYTWFHAGGDRHVAAWLETYDLGEFDPNNGQRKTAAHKTVVRQGMSGDEWARDAIAQLKNQDIFAASTILTLAERAGEDRARVKAKLSHTLSRLGYVPYDALTVDGRWWINKKPYRIYRRPTIQPGPGWEKDVDLDLNEGF